MDYRVFLIFMFCADNVKVAARYVSILVFLVRAFTVALPLTKLPGRIVLFDALLGYNT